MKGKLWKQLRFAHCAFMTHDHRRVQYPATVLVMATDSAGGFTVAASALVYIYKSVFKYILKNRECIAIRKPTTNLFFVLKNKKHWGERKAFSPPKPAADTDQRDINKKWGCVTGPRASESDCQSRDTFASHKSTAEKWMWQSETLYDCLCLLKATLAWTGFYRSTEKPESNLPHT